MTPHRRAAVSGADPRDHRLLHAIPTRSLSASTSKGRLDRVYVPGLVDAGFAGGSSGEAQVSQAADGNLPDAENAVTGCIGGAAQNLCHIPQIGGPGHRLQVCDPLPDESGLGDRIAAFDPPPGGGLPPGRGGFGAPPGGGGGGFGGGFGSGSGGGGGERAAAVARTPLRLLRRFRCRRLDCCCWRALPAWPRCAVTSGGPEPLRPRLFRARNKRAAPRGGSFDFW